MSLMMYDNARMSARSIAGNGVRSALTGLGVMIGVAAVIALVALGNGAQKSVEANLQALGANLLIVYSGEPRGTALVRANTANIRPTLTPTDIEMVSSLPGELVNLVSPVSTAAGQLKFENRNVSASITGTTPTYPEVRNFYPVHGTFFNDVDVERRGRVIVIGMQVYRDLFPPGADPVGQSVRVNGISFQVVGIMEEKGSLAQDNGVFIPISTFQRSISGAPNVQMISIQAASADVMYDLQQVIEQELLRLHRLPSMEVADFYVANQMDILSTVQGVTGTFTLLLASIAAISLVVGGIGIMNIMLVSVTGRTREIGVRMALGARGRDIMFQFLTEAVSLSVSGGIIGVLLGLGSAWFAREIAGTAAVPTAESVLMAFGFSVITGLFFGGYPAWRASKLNPIEALRYE